MPPDVCPGQTAFARTPRVAPSTASIRVIHRSARLDTEYAPSSASGQSAVPDTTATIAPPPSLRAGRQARAKRNGATTFVSITASQAASVVSDSACPVKHPRSKHEPVETTEGVPAPHRRSALDRPGRLGHRRPRTVAPVRRASSSPRTSIPTREHHLSASGSKPLDDGASHGAGPAGDEDSPSGRLAHPGIVGHGREHPDRAVTGEFRVLRPPLLPGVQGSPRVHVLRLAPEVHIGVLGSPAHHALEHRQAGAAPDDLRVDRQVVHPAGAVRVGVVELARPHLLRRRGGRKPGDLPPDELEDRYVVHRPGHRDAHDIGQLAELVRPVGEPAIPLAHIDRHHVGGHAAPVEFEPELVHQFHRVLAHVPGGGDVTTRPNAGHVVEGLQTPLDDEALTGDIEVASVLVHPPVVRQLVAAGNDLPDQVRIGQRRVTGHKERGADVIAVQEFQDALGADDLHLAAGDHAGVIALERGDPEREGVHADREAEGQARQRGHVTTSRRRRGRSRQADAPRRCASHFLPGRRTSGTGTRSRRSRPPAPPPRNSPAP